MQTEVPPLCKQLDAAHDLRSIVTILLWLNSFFLSVVMMPVPEDPGDVVGKPVSLEERNSK